MTRREIETIAEKLEINNAPVEEWIARGIIKKSETSAIKMVVKNEKLFDKVMEHSGTVYEWVGFRWIVTGNDLPENERVPILY